MTSYYKKYKKSRRLKRKEKLFGGDEEQTGTQTEEQTGTQTEQQDSSLMKAFNSVHYIFAAIGVLLLSIIFILITIDVLSLIYRDLSQSIILFINPNMYNKDTLDFNTLLYYKNSKVDEPYNIYAQQNMIGNMFTLGTYYVLFVSTQVIIYISLYLYFKFKGQEYKEVLSLDDIKKAAGVMCIIIASAFILNSYYNNSFIKSLQPKLISTHKNITSIKDDIYNNMTDNDYFLNALLNNNMKLVISTINEERSLNNVSKMIFTISLYNYFKMNISENKDEFTMIKDIFTIKQINTREINPVDYMYYSQNNFIQNLYPILKDYITGEGKVLDTDSKEYRVRNDVSNRINNLNKMMANIFKVPSKKQSFKSYIYISWIIVTALIACIGVLYIDEIRIFLKKINFIKE